MCTCSILHRCHALIPMWEPPDENAIISSIFTFLRFMVAKFYLMSLKSTRPCLRTLGPSLKIFCIYVMPLNPQGNYIFKDILVPLKMYLLHSLPWEEKKMLIFNEDLINEMEMDLHIDKRYLVQSFPSDFSKIQYCDEQEESNESFWFLSLMLPVTYSLTSLIHHLFKSFTFYLKFCSSPHKLLL